MEEKQVHICIYETRWNDILPKINTMVIDNAVIKEKVINLDKRLNGTLDILTEHVKNAPERLAEVKVMKKDISSIKQERLNSIKANQYRVAIIAGAPGAILALLKIIEILFK